VILRLYESSSAAAEARVTLSFGPFEIKTVKVKLR
jgi:hypothetical protein